MADGLAVSRLLFPAFPRPHSTERRHEPCASSTLPAPSSRTIAEGLEQTAEYMDRCDAEAGHLVIFDRREDRRWRDKIFRDRRASDRGVEIEVWGM